MLPVGWYIAGATFWKASLISTIKAGLGLKSEELKPLKIVFTSARSFRALKATLLATVDDIGGRTESRIDVSSVISGSGLEEARHDVVHAGFGVLRRHVEPNSGRHCQISVLVHKLRLIEQVQLAVVGARSENVGKLAVVVVPRELERPAAIVLLAWGWWPSICVRSPVRLGVIACRIVGAVAADLLHPVEGLGPELALGRVPQTSLLSPVGKNTGQFSPASHLDRPAWQVRLVAKGGEFGHGPQEVLISVDVISKREPGIP